MSVLSHQHIKGGIFSLFIVFGVHPIALKIIPRKWQIHVLIEVFFKTFEWHLLNSQSHIRGIIYVQSIKLVYQIRIHCLDLMLPNGSIFKVNQRSS